MKKNMAIKVPVILCRVNVARLAKFISGLLGLRWVKTGSGCN